MSPIEEMVRPEMWKIADHVKNLETSIIREILKFTSQPGVISFAGGLPPAELFPLETLKRLAVEIIDKYGSTCLQYTLSRGIIPLRELLAERATAYGSPTTVDNILMTCGAQQGIEILARAFIMRGDYVLLGNPTYVGALQAFNYYQAQYATVEMDDDGMQVELIEEKIKKYKPKLIYTVSNFQNPTGITLSLKRRKLLIEIAAAYNIPIADDNPYGAIRFSGEAVPTLKSLGGDKVIALRSFSKTIAPGLRLGWMNAPSSIIQQFEKVKQCADLHTSTFAQYLIYEFIKQGNFEPQIEALKKDYGKKQVTMLEALDTCFPDQISWTRPDGGMFLWVTLPEHMNAKELLAKAAERKVAYVYGEPFFAKGGGENCLRLNYSNASHEQIMEGISRLGTLFKAHL